MNSRLESRTAKTFGLIAGGTDTTTEMTFDYSPLGEETHRSATTTAPPLLPSSLAIDSGYDPAGRTSKVTNTGDDPPPNIDYLYDAAGQVIARTAKGKTTYLFYFASGGTLAEETRPSGATKTRYFNASSGQVLAEQRFTTDDPISGDPDQTSPTWVWLLRDPDSNVATELKETAAGAVVAAQRAYDPYGAPDQGGSSTLAGEKESILGYQASHTDEVTGNILLGPRIYDPTTDRFTTADSFVAGGADMALGTDPLTGNRYVFAAANPVAFYENGYEPCAKGSNCNEMYSGTKKQQRTRRQTNATVSFRTAEAQADVSLATHGYACTAGGAQPASAYLSGSSLAPCGFLERFGYLPAPRLTEAGWVMVKAAGGCSKFPDTSLTYDFQNACKTHDYGYDLLRADVLDNRNDVDTILRAHASANCSGRWFLARLNCQQTADVVYGGVRLFGWPVNFRSSRLTGFDYSEVDGPQ